MVITLFMTSARMDGASKIWPQWVYFEFKPLPPAPAPRHPPPCPRLWLFRIKFLLPGVGLIAQVCVMWWIVRLCGKQSSAQEMWDCYGKSCIISAAISSKHSKIYPLPLLYVSVCMSACNNGRYAAQILSIFNAEKFYLNFLTYYTFGWNQTK